MKNGKYIDLNQSLTVSRLFKKRGKKAHKGILKANTDLINLINEGMKIDTIHSVGDALELLKKITLLAKKVQKQVGLVKTSNGEERYLASNLVHTSINCVAYVCDVIDTRIDSWLDPDYKKEDLANLSSSIRSSFIWISRASIDEKIDVTKAFLKDLQTSKQGFFSTIDEVKHSLNFDYCAAIRNNFDSLLTYPAWSKPEEKHALMASTFELFSKQKALLTPKENAQSIFSENLGKFSNLLDIALREKRKYFTEKEAKSYLEALNSLTKEGGCPTEALLLKHNLSFFLTAEALKKNDSQAAKDYLKEAYKYVQMLPKNEEFKFLIGTNAAYFAKPVARSQFLQLLLNHIKETDWAAALKGASEQAQNSENIPLLVAFVNMGIATEAYEQVAASCYALHALLKKLASLQKDPEVMEECQKDGAYYAKEAVRYLLHVEDKEEVASLFTTYYDVAHKACQQIKDKASLAWLERKKQQWDKLHPAAKERIVFPLGAVQGILSKVAVPNESVAKIDVSSPEPVAIKEIPTSDVMPLSPEVPSDMSTLATISPVEASSMEVLPITHPVSLPEQTLTDNSATPPIVTAENPVASTNATPPSKAKYSQAERWFGEFTITISFFLKQLQTAPYDWLAVKYAQKVVAGKYQALDNALAQASPQEKERYLQQLSAWAAVAAKAIPPSFEIASILATKASIQADLMANDVDDNMAMNLQEVIAEANKTVVFCRLDHAAKVTNLYHSDAPKEAADQKRMRLHQAVNALHEQVKAWYRLNTKFQQDSLYTPTNLRMTKSITESINAINVAISSERQQTLAAEQQTAIGLNVKQQIAQQFYSYTDKLIAAVGYFENTVCKGQTYHPDQAEKLVRIHMQTGKQERPVSLANAQGQKESRVAYR